MTNKRYFNGGASVTALCAICTGGANDCRQPRPHALPLRGRRHPADPQQHASRPALAGDAMAANHRPLCARRRCAAPGRKHRRQLAAFSDCRGNAITRPPALDLSICAGRVQSSTHQQRRRSKSICGILVHCYRRWPAHGHHQPILQRLHLAPHGLTAGITVG